MESYELEPLEEEVSSDFTRLSTVIRMRGGGEEGVGEDVTYDALDHVALQEAGPVLPLAGSYTIDSFCGLLEGLDLFPAPPVREVSRLYRRWGFESAALDLALRQAGRSLAAGARTRAAPGHVRGVAAARRAADDRAGRAGARSLPDLRFKLDPDERLERRADRRAGRDGRGRLGRLQGLLQGHRRRPAARPGSLPARDRGVSRRVARGPGLTDETRPVLAGTRTASPGTRRSTPSTTSRRCRSRRGW